MSGRPRPACPRRTGGFTLVELLVSMLVLTLLVAFVGQLVSNATAITTGSRKRLDADSQARVLFDRMAFDMARMLKRPDVDYLFAKISGDNGVGGNDKLFFFSEAPAFFDETVDSSKPDPRSSVSLLGYRINAAFQLERLGKLLTWDGSVSAPSPGGLLFLSRSGATPTTSYGPDDNSTIAGAWAATIGSATDSPPYSLTSDEDDYHVLADQVFRMEFCFQLKDGRYSALPVTNPTGFVNNLQASRAPGLSDDSGQGYKPGARWFDAAGRRAYICVNNTAGTAMWNFLGVQDVKAIVVAGVILDATSMKILPTKTVRINGTDVKAPDLSTLSGAFADAAYPSAAGDPTTVYLPDTGTVAAARLMAEAWGNKLALPGFAAQAGIPKAVASQIHIYQRYFTLNSR